jgi:SPP1 family predicted phage head-tail adaptor
MRTKQARDLPHYISIERKEHIKDAIGGETDDIWSEFTPAYAKVTPITGKEFMGANATQNGVTHRVIIRYVDGVLPEMRVIHKGRVFNILAVRDFFEKSQWLELMCEELI